MTRVDFEDIGNYRGCLQVKRDGDRCFWRVGCDLYSDANDRAQPWVEIPQHLHEALLRHHSDPARVVGPTFGNDDDDQEPL